MDQISNKTDDAATMARVPPPAFCSEIDQLRRALQETTDALTRAFCWGDGPVPFEEIEGGRWDGVRALVESNGELLSTGTAWLYESSPNAKAWRGADNDQTKGLK